MKILFLVTLTTLISLSLNAQAQSNPYSGNAYGGNSTVDIINGYRQRQRENTRNNFNLYGGDRQRMNCRQDGLYPGQISCRERSYRDPYLYLDSIR